METSRSDQTVKQSRWPLIISLVIVAALVAGYFFIPAVNDFFKKAWDILTSENESRISAWVDKMGIWGPVFIIFAMVIQMFLIVIPSPLLMVVSALAYGPVWGSLISIAAIFFASTTGYWIGRSIGINNIYRLIGSKKEKRIEHYVERYGYWAVLITRLAPMISNDAISFVGGILKMKYWKFIGATIAGITPLALLIAYFGENNSRLKSGLIWTSAASLLFLAGYVAYDHMKKNKDREVH